jgi:hypothetical protein
VVSAQAVEAALSPFPWVPVLSVVVPGTVAVILALIALRTAKGTKGTEDRKVNLDEFRLFRESMEAEFTRLKTRIGDLEDRLRIRNDAVKQTNRRYNHLREAFIEFVQRVSDSWGSANAVPALTERQKELLEEPIDPEDLDFTQPKSAVRDARDATER